MTINSVRNAPRKVSKEIQGSPGVYLLPAKSRTGGRWTVETFFARMWFDIQEGREPLDYSYMKSFRM